MVDDFEPEKSHDENAFLLGAHVFDVKSLKRCLERHVALSMQSNDLARQSSEAGIVKSPVF
jgi:hypothetical protein